MLIGSPIGVELMADLTVFLLLVSLLHKWMLEELRPGESLTGSLIEETLQEGFEFGRHVVWELDRVLHDQVDQRVDTVCVEGWGAHEQLVDDDSQRPQIDSVIVGELLDKLRCHVKRCTLDGSQYNCVGGH